MKKQEQTDDELTSKWLGMKMMVKGDVEKLPGNYRYINTIIQFFGWWSDDELKMLRAWINTVLEGRADRREHPIETLHR
ncbi:MAG: hypothetical protein KKC03_13670 [Bacteroidetes bacterium]|nr:hypothetical protein [Bacteroidota bacterium]